MKIKKSALIEFPMQMAKSLKLISIKFVIIRRIRQIRWVNVDLKHIYWPILHNFGPEKFFFENQVRHFIRFRFLLTWCKKSENSNGEKYENFCYWRTDRLPGRKVKNLYLVSRTFDRYCALKLLVIFGGINVPNLHIADVRRSVL